MQLLLVRLCAERFAPVRWLMGTAGEAAGPRPALARISKLSEIGAGYRTNRGHGGTGARVARVATRQAG